MSTMHWQIKNFFLNNLQYSPLQSFRQIWFNNIRLKRSQTRMLCNSMIKVYESFYNNILLITAVAATCGDTIDECMMTSDEVRADAPFPRIVRNLTEENQNGEAGSKFILLEFNTSSPLP